MDVELIQSEIEKNGNTNMISDAHLPSKSQVFAIGDSHTIFFYNSMKIKEHWAFMTDALPLTMYKLINMGLDIYNIGSVLGNGHENYNIKENDYVLFYYGYNDMQKNIYKHNNDNYQIGIDNLLTHYISTILKLRDTYKIKPIIPCIYPNPRPDAIGVNVYGTHYERQMYIEYANKVLKDICYQTDLPFLDIYELIVDEYGYIKKDVTADGIHLDYNNVYIRKAVEDEIFKFCS